MNKEVYSRVLILFFILPHWIIYSAQGCSDSSNSAQKKIEHIILNFFNSPPEIDGRLNDDVWQTAAVLKDFVQTFPGDNTLPTYSTVVYLGYDESKIYIGIKASDNPAQIRATLAQRDNILNDDYIKIYLDTFNDNRRAYLLIFNPLGVQQDGIFVEGSDEPDYSFDIVMTSHGVITENGYNIEIAIPFSSLRYQSGEGHDWGVHVFRIIKHLNDEENSWMPLKRGRVNLLSQAGKITGITGIGRNGHLEVIPTFTVSEIGQRKLQSGKDNFVTSPVDNEPGISVKYNSSSNLSFDLTLNPDFAQVEADQFVLTANQRFPIFFEEKRPFFLEGIDVFQTPLKTVHTRTIIDPDGALKISGKFGDYSVGFLTASDNAPGNFSTEEQSNLLNRSEIEPYIGKNSYVTVSRLKRDIGKESYLGLITTSYNFVKKENYTLGFDGRLNFNSNTALTFQLSGTGTKRNFYEPDKNKNVYRSGYGFGYYANFLRSGRNFNLTIAGEGRSPDYSADVGFTTQTNINSWSVILRYNSDPKLDASLISWSALCTFRTDFDWQRRIKYAYVYPRVLLNFPNQTFLNLFVYTDYLKLIEEEFGPKRGPEQIGAFAGDPERSTFYKGFSIEVGTTPIKEISLYFLLDRSWDTFDYDFGSGLRYPRVSPAAIEDPNSPLDPGKGNSLDIKTSLMYQPNEALRFTFEYIKSRLVRNDTKRVAFDQNLYLLGSTYQFTRFIFCRLRCEYGSLESKVRAQLLLGWAPNPGTAVYLGYNEELNYDGYNPYSSKFEPGLHRNSRHLFIKLSYAFQFTI